MISKSFLLKLMYVSIFYIFQKGLIVDTNYELNLTFQNYTVYDAFISHKISYKNNTK